MPKTKHPQARTLHAPSRRMDDFSYLGSEAQRLKNQDRGYPAGKAEDSADHNIRQIVHPQIDPRKADQDSKEQNRQEHDHAAAQHGYADHREGRRGVTRRERIKPRTVDYLLVVVKAVAGTNALDQVLYQSLAHQVSDDQRGKKVEARIPPLPVEQKRKADNEPDYADVRRARSGFHYEIQDGGMHLADIIKNQLIKLPNLI